MSSVKHKAATSSDRAVPLLPPGQRKGQLEELLALLDVLEVVQAGLKDGSAEAFSSLQRLLQALHGIARRYPSLRLRQALQAISGHAHRNDPNALEQLLKQLTDVVAALQEIIEQMAIPESHLLLIEPDEETAALLQTMLTGPGRTVSVARTAAEARNLLQQTPATLIIMELNLPDEDGRNLLLWLRGRSLTASTPVIILSDRTEPHVKAECYALGADAYFEKPFDPVNFMATVTAHLTHHTVRHGVDPLTGVLDRAALEEAFLHARKVYPPDRFPICIALIDFDNLQAINRRHGPDLADAVLQQGVQLLASVLRPSDLIGRWTSDTFCVLFLNTPLEEAMRCLERALMALRQTPFQGHQGQPFFATFSACVLQVRPSHDSLAQLVAEAQRCLERLGDRRQGRLITPETTITPEKRRVLVVEDDEDIATLIHYRLTRDGFEVVHFANGREALTWARQNVADLVILDLKLPGMDGFELLHHLRQLPAYTATPIIILTCLNQEQHVLRGFELGADDYMVKPFSPVELSARVRRLLERHPTPTSMDD